MSAKMKTTKTNSIPTLDDLRKRWEKEQPKFKSGRVRNPRSWCLQERKELPCVEVWSKAERPLRWEWLARP